MTTEGDLLVPARDVSALVVGLESYEFTGSGTGLPGAAHSAVRFASWLLEEEVCLPERITLMTTGGRVADEIASIRGGERVRHIGHAEADDDFTQWINDYGPKKEDRLFLLFWVGHGFAYPDDEYEKLALLGSDAHRYKLRHVEFKNLLHAATGAAPQADVVAFVNACRAPIPAGWEKKLADGVQRLTTEKANEVTRTGKRFVVYAAAHGLTTKMAGDENVTFADNLLDRLDALEHGQGPAEIFGEELEAFVKELSRHQAGPNWTTYGYWDPERQEQLPPPPDNQNLTWDEWRELEVIAEAIDDAHDINLTGLVRSGAYYHAVGLNGREDEPPLLESVTDLMVALRDRPPVEDQAPPLIIACDYVANLPQRGGRPKLVAWCELWARDRGGDGVNRLGLAKDERPRRLPDRPYLSISVADFRGAPPGRYQLEPLLSAIGRLRKRTIRGPYTESQIPAGIADMINEVVADRKLPHLDDLVVEVVLPHRLIRRGWKPEYMKLKPLLGLNYAIVIRDQDIARGGRINGAAVARKKAWSSFQRMADYTPDQASGWSDRIEWFTCTDVKKPTPNQIAVTLNNRDKFCIGLGRKKDHVSPGKRGNGPLMGQVESIENGAAIIVSVQHAKGCGGCTMSNPSHGDDSGSVCEVSSGKGRVNQKVDQSPNGLYDLPYIIRDIRNELGAESELQVCVYMEDPSRLWWENVNKIRSQCRSADSHNIPEKDG